MALRFAVAVASLAIAVTTAHAQSVADLVVRSGGNLRIDVSCADYWATPATGLELVIDGVPQQALEATPQATWVASDVGYAVAPGRHHLELSAPGCAPDARDVDVWPLLPRMINGRLAVADASLEGPVGAPDGVGIGFGVYKAGRAAHPGKYSLFSTSYNYDAGEIDGGYLSMSHEHRAFVFAFDMRFGKQSTSGTASADDQITGSPRGPYTFTGTDLVFGGALRIGRRLPLRQLALEAGTGIGGDLSMAIGGTVKDSNLFAPSGPSGDWYVPLWVSATIKPSCDWGAQLLASYDVHPTARSEGATSIGAGLIWQPSTSCSEVPGLAVR